MIYSEDLRQKIVEGVEHQRIEESEAASLLGVRLY